jgi:metal-responsive CopG/Arc/MetJ family transcriptional regulator
MKNKNCPNIQTNQNVSEEKDKIDKIGITIPRKTLKEVDEVRGDIPRSRFVCRGIVEYLEKFRKKGLAIISISISIVIMLMTAAAALATG